MREILGRRRTLYALSAMLSIIEFEGESEVHSGKEGPEYSTGLAWDEALYINPSLAFWDGELLKLTITYESFVALSKSFQCIVSRRESHRHHQAHLRHRKSFQSCPDK